MQWLCDVNVLLPLLYGGHPHAPSAKIWYDSVEDREGIGIPRFTQLGAMRLLNNPVPMGKDVCNGLQAWQAMDRLLEDDRAVLLPEPIGLEGHLRRLTARLKYSPKVWADAYLAAFAIANERRLVTFDRAFRAYPGLDVEVLTEARH